jgi:AcrR family transcriptional regulator
MTDADAMPAELARLWRVDTGSRLGRPARLDVDAVVGAAIDLADREGLASVTLPRVAEVLGVTKMSLYRYVGSKDELLVLMQDGAGGPPESLRAAEGSWRERLRAWAKAMAAMCRAHPWLVELPVSGPPRGPNGLAWFDTGLAAMRDTGLEWGWKVRIVLVVNDFVYGMVRLERGLAAGRAEGVGQAEAERRYGEAMAALVDPERFPEAAALFASGALAKTGPDSAGKDFRLGLELILDGVAAAVDRC